MDKYSKENLFLLDFLVAELDWIPKCRSDLMFECGGEKCIAFRFLDNDPIEICESDFIPKRKFLSDDPKHLKIRSGKSVIFSLTTTQIEEAKQTFDITVAIYKRSHPEGVTRKKLLGLASFSITNLFRDLMFSLQSTKGYNPGSKILKGFFDVIDYSSSNTNPVGKIGVFVRLACFGKLIVTQFQMNIRNNFCIYKDTESKEMYTCQKVTRIMVDGRTFAARLADLR